MIAGRGEVNKKEEEISLRMGKPTQTAAHSGSRCVAVDCRSCTHTPLPGAVGTVRLSVAARTAFAILWVSLCMACLWPGARATPASDDPAPVLGADATCIGIYHRYPEVPTTAEATLDDMVALGVEHLVFWLSTQDLSPAYAVDSPQFAEFAALMRERGLKIVAGVGTMPLWSVWTKEHPDWVMQNAEGEPNQYGYPCWSNPEFARIERETAARIIPKAVEEADDLISSWFIYDETLWGWVNDNCHCPSCQKGYRAWLQAHGHHSEDVGFSTWDDVRLAVTPEAAHNARHAITTREYREDTLTGFLADQAALVRRLDPRHRPVTSVIYPVTGQFTCALHGNHARKWQRALDFLMTDPYPAGDPRTNYSLQIVSPLTAVLRDPAGHVPLLLVMQDFNSTTWGHILPMPSQVRKLCFQSIGYGATGIVPFIYDCGLRKDPHGKFTGESYPKRTEFKRIAHWFRDPLVSDFLCQAHPLASVGVVFPQNWYRRYAYGHPLSNEIEREFTIFHDLFQNHYQVGVLFPEDLTDPDVLSRYDAVVANGVWDVGPEYGVGAEHERAVRDFVERGGVLVVGGRTRLLPLAKQVRSEAGTVIWQGMDEPLAATSQAVIEALPGDTVLARYEDGSPAAATRSMGRGRVGIIPSILYPERLTDGERYVADETRYVFDRSGHALSRRAADVRRAVGDLMSALQVPRPVELRDEDGATAWFAQPMTLEGDGYWLTFIINWDAQAHDLLLRATPPPGEAWAVKDFLTGDALSASRAELADGWPLSIGGGEVRALAVAWESDAAERLAAWRPAEPYTPVLD